MLMKRIVTVFGVALTLLAASALRAETAPDALIERVSGEVIEAVKADKAIQAGDVKRINALVDEKVMPHVNFQRMTSLAMGRYWRQATPEQKQRLQEEFKTLLVRTYSGALSQVKDETVQLKPMRVQESITAVGSLRSNESVVLRPEVSGRIASIGFRDGQPVRRGQLLVGLDAALNEAEVAQARAEFDLARSNLKRTEDLYVFQS